MQFHFSIEAVANICDTDTRSCDETETNEEEILIHSAITSGTSPSPNVPTLISKFVQIKAFQWV
jgi:hypothetical protein